MMGFRRSRTSNRNKKLKSRRKRLIEAQNGLCALCTYDKSEGLTIHHIKPKRENGSDKISNLILLCRPCHVMVEHDLKKWTPVLKLLKGQVVEEVQTVQSIKDLGPYEKYY